MKIAYRPAFRSRIRIAIVVLITIAITITGTGSYLVAIDTIERNAVTSNQINIHKSKQVLDNHLRQITVSIMTLMISDAFKSLMKDVSIDDDSRYATHLSALQSLFLQIELSQPMTQAILLSTPIGDFYSTSDVRNPSSSYLDSHIYEHLASQEGGFVWTTGHEDEFFTSHERVISFTMEPITDFLVKDVYITLNVSEASVLESLASQSDSHGGQYLLLTENREEVLRTQDGIWPLIAHDEMFWSLFNGENDAFEYRIGDDDYFINKAKLENKSNWYVVNVQPKSELFREMDRIHLLVIAIACVSIIIALILSKMLMSFLMKPLNKLTTLMRKVELNNLDVRFEREQSDEFSQLGIRFNMMVEEINNLIQEIKHSEQEKRKSEVKALQAHIAPHFLYNTLNTIYFKCELGHNEDVGEMVLALSLMFKLGLNEGNTITTLDKELLHVQQYMKITQSSYPALFQYKIDVADNWLNKVKLLKILIQPLVENAILHGFKNMREGGFISISVSYEEQHNTLVISVMDNGHGMDVKQIKERILHPQEKDGSYALFNIHHRLQLYYGDRARIDLTSEPYVQTTVSLFIPLHEED